MGIMRTTAQEDPVQLLYNFLYNSYQNGIENRTEAKEQNIRDQMINRILGMNGGLEGLQACRDLFKNEFDRNKEAADAFKQSCVQHKPTSDWLYQEGITLFMLSNQLGLAISGYELERNAVKSNRMTS